MCWAFASSSPCQPVNVSPPFMHIYWFATVLISSRSSTECPKDVQGTEESMPASPPPFAYLKFCHAWLKAWIRNGNGGCLFSLCCGKLSAHQPLMTSSCHYWAAYRLWKRLWAVRADAHCVYSLLMWTVSHCNSACCGVRQQQVARLTTNPCQLRFRLHNIVDQSGSYRISPVCPFG